MSVRVETQPEADSQLEYLDTWWREHRSAAATQVLDEFERIVKLLSHSPKVGARYHRSERPHLRWVGIRKTPYLVIYEHVPGSDLVSIVSVWSGMRKQDPPL